MRNNQKKLGQHGSEDDYRFIVKESDELLAFLYKVLKHKSRNQVKSILSRGQVKVNGKIQTQFNYLLERDEAVVISSVAPKETHFEGITLLYEDDDLIVIDKAAGILSMSSGNPHEQTAYRELVEYVRETHPKNRIFIVHRLDRDTSGVMVFAKNEKVKKLLQDTWHSTVKERCYIALVEGNFREKEGTITSWLKETKTMKMYSSPKPNGGKKAVTHYKVLKANSAFSLLEIHLETGRKNQIRVHMESVNHPIAGDKKYSSKSNPIGRLGLHAHSIEFKHPLTGKIMRFESKIPKSFYKPFRD